MCSSVGNQSDLLGLNFQMFQNVSVCINGSTRPNAFESLLTIALNIVNNIFKQDCPQGPGSLD